MGSISDNKFNPIHVSMSKAHRLIINIKYVDYFPNMPTNAMYKILNLSQLKYLFNSFILKLFSLFFIAVKIQALKTFY